MNTLVTFELARHEQQARVRHAMQVRAIRAYQRDHPVEHHRRARLASVLRQLAARVEGRTSASPTARVTPVRHLSTH